ncbi:porphobilinogen deaminase (hydroxymethylbilane synthase) [Candidatus Hydrogenisulfobacillus filiaventi]|uniref:Porphobilinogen deaminase n=1 Tax=Candidatus Hydrogenisulfobacillus filiaventi TaxID=2707344 RepID=A0A6F8ZFC0_9FIRM|nr:porphobilinogen deaminase (hydroxymethylbilane synthase) [Candidatus Hydrogenisulfobacillus filiaventi]
MAEMLVIGSRGSPLALKQTEMVAAALAAAGVPTRVEVVHTEGDRVLDRPLSALGSVGVFAGELESALAAGRVDLAVHSLKDLPAQLAPGLMLGALLEREDPRDVLLSRVADLEDLPPGARIGTSSLRRTAFLRHRRPDLVVVPVRGNLGTRLRKWREEGWEALTLAAAGLLRMELGDLIRQYLDPWWMVPAPGQGVIAVEVRAADTRVRELVAGLDHAPTRRQVEAERAVLAAVGAGCQMPLGAYARWREDGRLEVAGQAASPDGRRLLRAERAGPPEAAAALGEAVGRALLDQGARDLLNPA